MTATITRAERAEHNAKLRRMTAEREPLWNPRANELYGQHEVEIENMEGLLPEGISIREAFGTKIMERRPATDEECRQCAIQFADIEFDVEGNIAGQVADRLERLAADLLQSARKIRAADLTWDAEDEDAESEAEVA